MQLSQLSRLGARELESCSILQWLLTCQEKLLEASSCEVIKMACIFSSFPQPGFLQLKRDGVTAATFALCHPAGTDWQSFNLVLTESYHEARRSGLMVVTTNYGPLVLFSTYMLSVCMYIRCMYLISLLRVLNLVVSSYFQQQKKCKNI